MRRAIPRHNRLVKSEGMLRTKRGKVLSRSMLAGHPLQQRTGTEDKESNVRRFRGPPGIIPT